MTTASWAAIIYGPEAAAQMNEAMGREIDRAVLHGTQLIQETEMIRAGDLNADTQAQARVAEVSATVDAGLSQDDVDGLGEAERLGLIVGAAYGQALAERDLAQQEAARLSARLGRAQELLGRAVDSWPETTWAHDSLALESLVQGIRDLWPVDSDPTPTQED